MELQAHYEEFQAAGIELVVITYDSEADHAKFSKKHGIKIPLLRDIDRESVNALGILNTEHEPGNMAYGIPHPGFYVLTTRGEIVEKSFLEKYAQRLSAESILNLADNALPL